MAVHELQHYYCECGIPSALVGLGASIRSAPELILTCDIVLSTETCGRSDGRSRPQEASMLQGKGFLSWRQVIHPFGPDETRPLSLVPKPLVSLSRLYPRQHRLPQGKGFGPNGRVQTLRRSVPSPGLSHRREVTLHVQTKALHDMVKVPQS